MKTHNVPRPPLNSPAARRFTKWLDLNDAILAERQELAESLVKRPKLRLVTSNP